LGKTQGGSVAGKRGWRMDDGGWRVENSALGLMKKIFFDLCKKHRLSQRAKYPVFIDRNPAFFTKIHEKNKSCQTHHALEIAPRLLVKS
jgi:hypothetical protein